MYKCKYFKIQELVPPSAYNNLGEAAWRLLDPRALRSIDLLREKFGPIIINTWHNGGNRQWSGLRTDDCPLGAKYSQHKYGRAFDLVFKEVKPQKVIDYILGNPEEFPEITAVETGTPTWVHIDVRNCDRITTFPM